MASAISVDWRVRQLRALLPNLQLGKVRLFVNGRTPDPADRWYDYQEPTGSWYSAQDLVDLGPPAPNEAGQAQTQTGSHAWSLGVGDAAVTIYGAWLTDERGRFWAATTLPTPLVLSGPGAGLTVQVVLTL